jgi:hypothetical protein
MTYYFNMTLRTAFEDAVARTVLALKAEGFGMSVSDPTRTSSILVRGSRPSTLSTVY